ncbi:MAG: HAMP domain-containing histidine kinase [FCB group bacterium]|nr:HAMP domain-containing histidine kinase [FCB group bacterium]
MTEKTIQEPKNREWLNRLATFPERNPLPVIELDNTCSVTYMNPACKHLLERLGKTGDDIRDILPRDCDRLVKDSLEGKIAIYAEEVMLENKVLLWSGHPIRDLNVVHFYATDITRLKMIEEDLLRAKLKAEQSEKVKSLFLANMSHEIRTPLNAIIGFTELIESLTREHLDDEKQFFFSAIRQNGERLMRTVHEILDVSQIEAGTFKLKIEAIDLVSKLREVLEALKPYAEEKELALKFESKLPVAEIRGDRHSIFQSLQNLVHNAIKFTPSGRVTVSIQPDEHDLIRVEVRDTGVGMSEEYLQNLYNIFSQESIGYTKKFQGVGLGLAITKRYLDLNKVRIRVESEKDRGSTFILWFDPHAFDEPTE